ncbi:hypothetical protein ACJMK2_022217 [Sinanodonta woodiana]|uniref:C2H2-type domain-containing protein n=1 Tax=Sinanodonta woodiana TaxID=1069815 RepID=A0ABD3TID4_SINWO
MKCWLCTVEFPSKRDIKAHLAAPPHDRMRVICSWCHLEKCYKKKNNDLKKHGFYLALHPKHYVWIVRPTDYHSQPATMARWAISNWLNMYKLPSRSRKEWIDGWPEPYSPTTPSVGDDDIQLDSVQLGNVNTRTSFFSEGQGFSTWYESMSRKLMVPLDRNRNRPSSGLCYKLGIPSSFVTSLFRKTVSTSEIVQEYPCPVPAGDAAMSCQPTRPESSKCFTDNQLATPQTSEKPKRGLTSASDTNLSKCMDDQSLSKGVEFPIQGTSDNTIEPFSEPVTRSPSLIVSSLNMTIQPIMPNIVSAETPLDLSTLPSEAFISPPKMFPTRDWDKEEIAQFSAGPLSIRRPPRSWKKMSADTNLLSVEYAAITLEASLTLGHIPNIDRKSRYYNYEVLRVTAVEHDIPDSSRFLDILDVGAKCRDKSLGLNPINFGKGKCRFTSSTLKNKCNA